MAEEGNCLHELEAPAPRVSTAPRPSDGPPCRTVTLLQCLERGPLASSPLLCSASTSCCFKLESIAGEVSKKAISSCLGFAPPWVNQVRCCNAAESWRRSELSRLLEVALVSGASAVKQFPN